MQFMLGVKGLMSSHCATHAALCQTLKYLTLSLGVVPAFIMIQFMLCDMSCMSHISYMCSTKNLMRKSDDNKISGYNHAIQKYKV